MSYIADSLSSHSFCLHRPKLIIKKHKSKTSIPRSRLLFHIVPVDAVQSKHIRPVNPEGVSERDSAREISLTASTISESVSHGLNVDEKMQKFAKKSKFSYFVKRELYLAVGFFAEGGLVCGQDYDSLAGCFDFAALRSAFRRRVKDNFAQEWGF